MHDHLVSRGIADAISTTANPATGMAATRLTALVEHARFPDSIGRAAAFGRWWYDPLTAHMLLSLEAAAFLEEEAGLHADLADCMSNVLPEDCALLVQALASASQAHEVEVEFRLLSRNQGLRWMRLVGLPSGREPGGLMITGILTDITAAKHAAMREQFSFESTQLLVGTHTLGEAICKIIELVCTDLGWDCGMYWSMEQLGASAQLICLHSWSDATLPVNAFPRTDEDGIRLSIAAGKGLIGGVWSSGRPRWIENDADPEAVDFVFSQNARSAGIRSGYAFPVAYESDDGRHHRPGVLVFFSRLPRQNTAQLPSLSAAIGGLIAQTAQRIAQQEHIRQLAQVDMLSGLSNRRHFQALLDAACQHQLRANGALGMLYIDLDRFKPINDALGHEVGDAVLHQFAQRLARLVPPGGDAGRVGGDEFALFFPLTGEPDQVAQLADSILLAARTRFLVNGRELAISASVGVSTYPEHGDTGADLLRHADTAMYRAKRSGRNGANYFSHDGNGSDEGSQSALMQQITVEAELLHALAGDQLFMHYQPVFDPDGRTVRAVEALIRWRRPSGEVVPPDVFIPIAERSHLIVDIGRWVVRQACRDLPHMQRAGMGGVRMNVNMAPLEFLNVNLPDELADIALDAGVDPRDLCLELTESMMMNHADQVIPVMRALRRRGFKISVDDFGMGYSSLSRLKDLPISSLKIDRSFVQGLPSGPQDRAIVQTIIDIGRNMQLDVIAEGVETEAQLQHLCRLGCKLVQGYLMGRPMPLDDLIRTYGTPHSPQNEGPR